MPALTCCSVAEVDCAVTCALLPRMATMAGPAAGGRQMTQLQRPGRLLQIGQRQMCRAVESARTEHQRRRLRLRAVEELLQGLVGLPVVDQQQDRVGDQPGERDEVGARCLDRTAEQLVDLGVTRNSVVVRQQSVAVRLGRGGELRADLPGRTGLGFDQHRLLQNRFHRGGERPRHEIVDAARRKRIDDGDRPRRKRLLRECRPGCEQGRGASGDELTAVHGYPPRILLSFELSRVCEAVWPSGKVGVCDAMRQRA